MDDISSYRLGRVEFEGKRALIGLAAAYPRSLRAQDVAGIGSHARQCVFESRLEENSQEVERGEENIKSIP